MYKLYCMGMDGNKIIANERKLNLVLKELDNWYKNLNNTYYIKQTIYKDGKFYEEKSILFLPSISIEDNQRRYDILRLQQEKERLQRIEQKKAKTLVKKLEG